MNRNIIISLFLILFPVVAFPQTDIGDMGLSVTYKSLYHYSEEESVTFADMQRLDICGDKSFFHSIEIPDGGEPENFLPQDYQVYKSFPDDGRTAVTCKVGGLSVYYIEDSPEIDWQLEERDSVICGYECSLAVATYRGRTWNAWYTIDIPYSEGPWKLSGLPGLILKAYDRQGDFSFTAIAISKGDNRKLTLDSRNYSLITSSEMAQMQLLYGKDWGEFMRRYYNSTRITVGGADNLSALTPSYTPCLLEYP